MQCAMDPPPNGYVAEKLAAATRSVCDELRAVSRLTMTWDQGSEIACHDLLAEKIAEGKCYPPLS